jgi:hypothetical protein
MLIGTGIPSRLTARIAWLATMPQVLSVIMVIRILVWN